MSNTNEHINDDGLNKVNVKVDAVFSDYSPHQIRGEVHMVNGGVTKTIDHIKERVSAFTETFLPKLINLISSGKKHVNITDLDNLSYPKYKRDWETLFQEIKTFHEEKQWTNPFLARVMYNAGVFLPTAMMTKELKFHLLRLHEDKETYEKLLGLNLTMPHGLPSSKSSNYLFNGKSIRSFRLKQYIASGEVFAPYLTRVTEEMEVYLLDLLYIAKNSPTHYSDDKDDIEMYVDCIYNIAVGYILISFFNPSKTFIERFHSFRVDKLSYLVIPSASDFYAESKGIYDLEEIYKIITTSEDKIELAYYSYLIHNDNHLLNWYNGLTEEQVFKIMEHYIFHEIDWRSGILANFWKKKELDFFSKLFNEAIADMNNNALELAKSEPHARWIRTLKGEYFVDKEKPEEKEKDEKKSEEENEDAGSSIPSKKLTRPIGCICKFDKHCPRHGHIEDLPEDEDPYASLEDVGEVKRLVYTAVGDINAYARLRRTATVGLNKDDTNIVDTIERYTAFNIAPFGDEALPHGKLGSVKDNEKKDDVKQS